jgi:hypothetical protein
MTSNETANIMMNPLSPKDFERAKGVRSRELSVIEKLLPKDGGIALIGEPRSGKTSLANYVGHQHAPFIFVDLMTCFGNGDLHIPQRKEWEHIQSGKQYVAVLDEIDVIHDFGKESKERAISQIVKMANEAKIIGITHIPMVQIDRRLAPLFPHLVPIVPVPKDKLIRLGTLNRK